MNIVKTEIDGVLIIEPRLFCDSRGYFFESFSEREFEEKVAPILGHSVHFCQDNESMNSYGVMRGLHFQHPSYTQSKLVRCVKGRVLDVAVDIRKGSPTYGKHVAVELTEDNHVQFFFPKGFAHGSSFQKQQSSNTSVITSTTLRLMEVFLSLMIPLVLIGEFLQSMLIYQRKIRSMQCLKTLIVRLRLMVEIIISIVS